MRDYFDTSTLVDTRFNIFMSGAVTLYLLSNFFNIFLDGNITWSAYALAVVLLVFLPPLLLRDISAMVPFEVLLFLAFPFTVKGLQLGFMASHTLNYLSAAGVALLLVTELDTFTSFRTTSNFSVLLVSFTTVAVAGVWAVARWLSDIYLETSLIVSENTLMWEFAAAALAGIVSGKIFSMYFSFRERREEG